MIMFRNLEEKRHDLEMLKAKKITYMRMIELQNEKLMKQEGRGEESSKQIENIREIIGIVSKEYQKLTEIQEKLSKEIEGMEERLE